MSSQDWRKIEQLFDAALEEPADTRSAWLRQRCPESRIRQEVEKLLAAAEKSDEFLNAPASVFAADLVGYSEENDLPERVGPYRPVRELGRGGMGAVFLAERADGQFEQQVALKILGRRFPSRHIRERFLAERQILASLSHPAIARLLDGGVSDGGMLYFAMEYVDGRPVDRFCREERLRLRERLQLFERICDAVSYAHRSLVIHRDLKPSNILVMEDGTVKLLDFGIAKLLDSASHQPGLPFTATGLHLMTPEYASPEQVQGDPVTIASDVYQLGVLLHELMTGERLHDFSSRSLTDITHAVTSEESPRPSDSISDASAFQLSPDRLRKRLKGDLDAITKKALRKEPKMRYDSVEGLSEDLRRYLDSRPVMAHQGTLKYRLGKYIRRNRWAVTAALIFILALAGYAVSITAQQTRTARERDRAEQYAAFLTDLFASPDPFTETPGDREITVREFLDQGSDRVRTELSGDAALQASLLKAIADVYQSLKYDERAEDLYEEVLSHYRSLHGKGSVEEVEVLGDLAWVSGDPAVSDSLYSVQLTLARNLDGPHGLLAAESSVQYGGFLFNRGRSEEARNVLEGALTVLNGESSVHDDDLIGALYFLGKTYSTLGALGRADSLLEEAYELRLATLGDDHPRTAIIMTERAAVAEKLGELDRAEEWKRDALSIFEKKLGTNHPYTVKAMNNLAVLHTQRGAHREAELLLRRVLEIQEAEHGTRHQSAAGVLQNLATSLMRQGRLDEAEPLFHEVRRRYEQILPQEHHLHAFPLLSLNELYAERGDFPRAERTARDAAARLRTALPDNHPLIAIADSRLGEALSGQRRYKEAEELLLNSYELLRGAEGFEDRKMKALQRLVAFYEASGRPDEAATYRAALSR